MEIVEKHEEKNQKMEIVEKSRDDDAKSNHPQVEQRQEKSLEDTIEIKEEKERGKIWTIHTHTGPFQGQFTVKKWSQSSHKRRYSDWRGSSQRSFTQTKSIKSYYKSERHVT